MTSTKYIIQKGSSNTLRANGMYHVVAEVWQGYYLANTWIQQSFESKEEAATEAKRLNDAEYAKAIERGEVFLDIED